MSFSTLKGFSCEISPWVCLKFASVLLPETESLKKNEIESLANDLASGYRWLVL